MTTDVLIIGGGAAGLCAAIAAARGGAQTLVLEAAAKPGRKILASGNGRCNLMNAGEPVYFSGAAFAANVFAHTPGQAVRDFFTGLGLQMVEEEAGRVYPACGQAAAVVDVLLSALRRLGAQVECQRPVTGIRREQGGFAVASGEKIFRARRVILACGGMAGGRLGHDGSAYRLMTALGHTLRQPRPALTQFAGEKNAVAGLSGLRCPARLSLARQRRVLAAASGEALFADYGVSGVCAMQLSGPAGEDLKKNGPGLTLYIDFAPMLGLSPRAYERLRPPYPGLDASCEAVAACLRQRQARLPEGETLVGLLPRLLRDKIMKFSSDQWPRLLSAYPVPLSGVRGFEYAQVTAGGLDTGEFDPQTLESLIVPGLYAAGEALDVDGDCGGFNLLFAWASGLTAGRACRTK